MTDFVISEDWLQRMDNSPMLSVMQIRDLFAEARSRPLSDELKKEREGVLGELQKFIDNADSHIGCPNGTLGTAYLIRWMGGQGYDCD